MLLDLCLPPGNFQRMVHNALREFTPNVCLVYPDGVVLRGKAPKEYIRELKNELSRLEELGSRPKLHNLRSAQPTLNSLNLVIQDEGNQICPRKTQES